MTKLKNKKIARKKARERVPGLFQQSQKHPDVLMATRLIRRARRLAMKFRMSLKPYKQNYCKHCKTRVTPGVNCRVRVHGGKVIHYCLECKNFRRIPIKKQRTSSVKK